MQAAVSTACLFPLPTEEALYELCLQGVQAVEIFLNAPSESRSVYANDIRLLCDRFGTVCTTVHPWTAPQEGFMLFSRYHRRCPDFIEEAKQIFAFMNAIGATYYVLHGAPVNTCKQVEFYCERFRLLVEAAKPFGITVTQENVYRYESQNLKFLRAFCRLLGEDAKLTLDTKQAVRSGMSISEAVRVLGNHIVHVHISDHGPLGDCLRIGKGKFAIPDFLRDLASHGFDQTVTLELYREAFTDVQELAEDYARLQRMIQAISPKAT